MSDEEVDPPPAAEVDSPDVPKSYYLPIKPSELVFVNSKSLPEFIKFVSLDTLEGDGVNTLSSVLLAMIIRYKKTGVKSNDRNLFSRLNQEKKDNANFDRTILIACLNSGPGRNTALIPLNGPKSDQVFGQFLEGRDGPNGFGPGAVVVIPRPRPVSNYYGESTSGVPVLDFTSGMRLVNVVASKLTLPDIPVSPQVKRLQAFQYNKCSLEVTNFGVDVTPCCAYLCDSIGLKTWDGNWRSGCPCYVPRKSLGHTIFDLSFKVKINDSTQWFEVVHFTSRSFTNLMTKSGIPLSLNQLMLENVGADMQIGVQLVKIVRLINANGGFKVEGWLRFGRVQDHASTAPAGEKKTTVASSNMTYHLTRIVPNCDEKVYRSVLIDIRKMYDDCEKAT